MHPKHQEKIHELVDLVASTLKVTCGRLYGSNGIDPEEYDPKDYVLAKILLTAALRQHVNDFEPLSKGPAKEDLKNLAHF